MDVTKTSRLIARQTCSIGLSSGEYGGRCTSRMLLPAVYWPDHDDMMRVEVVEDDDGPFVGIRSPVLFQHLLDVFLFGALLLPLVA